MPDEQSTNDLDDSQSWAASAFGAEDTFERAAWNAIAIIGSIYLAFAACFVGAL